MNYLDRVSFIRSGTTIPTASVPATVVLVSAKEGTDGAFAITDVSIRVPGGVPVEDTSVTLRVGTGPLAGDYSVQQVRPNRHHTRYIGRRVN